MNAFKEAEETIEKIEAKINYYRKEHGMNNVFLRAAESLDLNDQSMDYLHDRFNKSNITKEEVEEFLEDKELYDISIPFKRKEAWAIKYKGVHADEEYHDQTSELHGGTGKLYIFKGKKIGRNLFNDGDIVKPLEILDVLDEYGNSL